MISRLARFGIAGLVAVADRATKHWIETNFGAWDSYPIIPNVFNIINTQNRGAAFGVLSQSESQVRHFLLIGVALVVMLFVAVQLWRMPKGSWPANNWVAVALSLLVGGAAGNLYDRIFHGSVTDFLQVFLGSYEWPSFNVADSAISTGAVLLLLSLLRSPARTVS
jgi:signal peptidase II